MQVPPKTDTGVGKTHFTPSGFVAPTQKGRTMENVTWWKSRTVSLLLGLALIRPAFAQIPAPVPTPAPASGATQAPAPPAVPEDRLGRSTPYGTVTGFLSAAEHGDFERASQYLDSYQSPQRKQELARQLKLVMDQAVRINLEKVSREPEGNLEDKLQPNRESVGVAKRGSDSLEILLVRVNQGKKPPIWLFSSITLLSVPDFAQGLEAPWVERHVPRWLIEKNVVGIPLYRWIAAPLILLVGFALVWILTWGLAFAFRSLLRRYTRGYGGAMGVSFVGPVRLLVLTLLIQIASHVAAPTLAARQFWRHVLVVLTVVGLAWLFMRVIDAAADLTMRRMRQTHAQGRIAVVHLFRGLSKPLLMAVALLVILYLEGLNPTAVITGLGVGGIAFAFAAQKTLENLFGTVMLVSDQPIRVGDFCKFGDCLGTVEEIGLRSTRVRTLDRTVITVPNGQLASLNLENFQPRDKFRFNHTLGLRYETTADQLRYVLAEIRRLLYEHPKVESQSARIRFVRFGGSSLDLEIFAYILAPDYPVFLEIQEDLLLRIMDIIEASGTGVAFPSRVTYVAKDSGLRAEKGEAAAAQVRQWRDKHELPFPNYPPERIAEIENKLEYPPPDSALHRGE
jgi:MscS family membrane protein